MLYERCVSQPVPMARFLRAAHGGRPRILGEDFSGSGALARAWANLDPRCRSIAVDQDAKALRVLTHLAGDAPVEPVRADVLAVRSRVDILTCTNFPIMYWHTREALVKYLRRARQRLNPRGILVCDLYGGSDAMTTGRYTQMLKGDDGERIEYTWEQCEANPLTGRVRNAIHFRVTPRTRGKDRSPRPRPVEYRSAFEYDWRLWSIPELRDAMHEAGFARVEIYARLGDALDQHGKVLVSPTTDPSDLPDPWVVYVVARR